MKAKKFVEQLAKYECMIENKEKEIMRYRQKALRISSQLGGERVQASSSQQKMADAIIEYVDSESELFEQIKLLKQRRNEIIETIEKLNTVEYDVLHKRYVLQLDYYKIAESFDRTYSWVTTVHGRALKNLQHIFNEKGN